MLPGAILIAVGVVIVCNLLVAVAALGPRTWARWPTTCYGRGEAPH
ncbi:hypothetical protein [Amycolatopsis minnesotensis]|uniref:Uncharacterized protein n=1 Tax=Amycolatopsis minnesotensis TaxID=337894 RepID=A0ABN2SMJ9_9PSEU